VRLDGEKTPVYEQLRRHVEAYNDAPLALLRTRIIIGFVAVLGFFVILFAAFSSLAWSVSAVMLLVLTALAYFVISEVAHKTYLFDRTFRFLYGTRIVDHVVFVVVVLVVMVLLWVVGWVDVLLIALVLAGGFVASIDRMLERQRCEPLAGVETILKSQREQGASEASLQQLVAQCGSARWEPIFEAVFGYPAMVEARNHLGVDELGRPRHRHRSWRDVIVRWIDRRQATRQIPPAKPDPAPSAPVVPEPHPQPKPMLQQTDAEHIVERAMRRSRWQGILALLFGPQTRFLVGGLLIAACLWWMHQNELVPRAELRSGDFASIQQRVDPSGKDTHAMTLPHVPGQWTAWVDSYLIGAAGLLLVVSSFVRGAPGGAFAVVTAGVLVSGTQPILIALGAGIVALVVAAVLSMWWRSAAPSGGATEADVALVSASGDMIHDAPGTNSAQGAKSLQLFRTVLVAAQRAGASDIHFEPLAEGGRVRMRVQGSMVDVVEATAEVFPRMLGLVRVLCELDIAGRRKVQEGRFSAHIGESEVDYRVSLTPAVHGQKLVMRVLDAGASPQQLDDLMLPDWMDGEIRDVLGRQSGMLLACGPTGSGKTTTLYAALREVDADQRNIVTIEDPVEYQLPGATQISVGGQVGQSFATLLQSILRQDPDVILVGEIRDEQTARTAMQAAVTGHLVLSTVHARDTAGAIVRLLDLGIEPNLLTSSLQLVLAQRLVRQLCPDCKVARPPTREETTAMGMHGREVDQVYDAVGCGKCMASGYVGRRALFELMVVNDALRDAIHHSPSLAGIRGVLDRTTFVSLTHTGWQMVAQGLTSPQEIHRVISET
jgi:general secretion pathway protein E